MKTVGISISLFTVFYYLYVEKFITLFFRMKTEALSAKNSIQKLNGKSNRSLNYKGSNSNMGSITNMGSNINLAGNARFLRNNKNMNYMISNSKNNSRSNIAHSNNNISSMISDDGY